MNADDIQDRQYQLQNLIGVGNGNKGTNKNDTSLCRRCGEKAMMETIIDFCVACIIVAILLYVMWKLFCWFIVPIILADLIVSIGGGIALSILETCDSVNNAYPKHLYKRFKLHRLGKQLNLIPQTEHLVWNDDYEERRMGEAFRYVMG